MTTQDGLTLTVDCKDCNGVPLYVGARVLSTRKWRAGEYLTIVHMDEITVDARADDGTIGSKFTYNIRFDDALHDEGL